MLGNIANPFAAELARAVREVMSARGYNVFICVSEHSAREDIAAFEPLADHRVDGVIVATREQGRVAAEALVRRMESAETPAREERVMPCELVVRASTVSD